MKESIGGEAAALERAAVAEEVAGLVRHELRNKFASVRNAVFYLRRKVEKTDLWAHDPRLPLFFQLIEDEVAAAGALLADRLTFAHAFAQQVVPVRLGAVAEELLATVAVPPGVRLAQRYADATPLALDREEGALLVRCLVENALEALPDGGALAVETAERDGAVTLAVSNEGDGLAPSIPDNAFEPLVTTRPGHAGLGLAIARRIAGRYHGTVTLAATPRGARAEARFQTSAAADPPRDGAAR